MSPCTPHTHPGQSSDRHWDQHHVSTAVKQQVGLPSQHRPRGAFTKATKPPQTNTQARHRPSAPPPPPGPVAQPSSCRYQDQHTLSSQCPTCLLKVPDDRGRLKRLSRGCQTGTTSRETRESATTALSFSYGQNKTRLEIESSMCDCQTLAPCKMFPWHSINYCHRYWMLAYFRDQPVCDLNRSSVARQHVKGFISAAPGNVPYRKKGDR